MPSSSRSRSHGGDAALAVGQAKVRHDEIGIALDAAERVQEVGEIAATRHARAPGFEQRAHRIDRVRIVVDHGDQCARDRRRTRRVACPHRERRNPRPGDRRCARRQHAKARAATDARHDLDAMLEQRGEAANDREAKSHAGARSAAARFAHLVELFENARLQRERDSDAGVDDVDGDLRAAAAGADQHAPALGVANRVGDEIAHDALEQAPRRCARQGACRATRSASLFASACGRSSAATLANIGASATRAGVGVSAPASRRDRSRSCSNCASSAPTARWMLATSGCHCAPRARVDKRRDVQPERVQRLSQIMACCGQELALAAVRGFGRGARLVRRARLSLELLDEVEVLVAHRERAGEQRR